MSMIGNFFLLSDQRLAELLADPKQVYEVCDEGYDSGSDLFVDVDKAWHCIHFLLTGTADGGEPPLNFVVVGGREVGDEDVGYGPARVFMSDDVAEIADAVGPIDHEALVRRFDPELMDRLGVYPDAGRWTKIDARAEDSFGYYSGAFEAIKSLVQRGAAVRSGMLVWLS
jgi:hypothetical protein